MKTLKGLRQLQFVVLLVLVSSGCQMRGKILRDGNGLADFMNTEIIASDIGIADGNDELVVVVHLKNSDNSVVGNFKPEYEIVNGAAVWKGPCTTSASNGMSICILKSTVPGSKRLRLTNAKAGLEKDVLFALKGTSSLAGFTAGGSTAIATNGGYKANVSVGPWAANPGVGTPGGYKAYISVQGAMDSRETQ